MTNRNSQKLHHHSNNLRSKSNIMTGRAKRKRERSDTPSDHVGLGTTLPSPSATEKAEATIQNAATLNDSDGDGGWTVVQSNKRRRNGSHSRNCNDATDRDSGHNQLSSRSSILRSDAEDEADAGPDNRSKEATSQFENPFAPKDSSSGRRLSQPSNPFSTRDGESERKREAVDDTDSTNVKGREERRQQRKIERHYPVIKYSHNHRLKSHTRLFDLQGLVLYILADGIAPQWVSVSNRSNIDQVVMLMVPGLEPGMFNGNLPLESSPGDLGKDSKPKRLYLSPDDYYPKSLKPDCVPAALKPLSDIFPDVWPIVSPTEKKNNLHTRLHSSVHSMLSAQIPKSQEEKRLKDSKSYKGPLPQSAKHWVNKRTRITKYLATVGELQENGYVVHPACYTSREAREEAYETRMAACRTAKHGWVDSNVSKLEDGNIPEDDVDQGSVTAGRQILAMDCEMCLDQNDEQLLTRISITDWHGKVVMDELVKPDVPIKDYVTQYSGITEAMLRDVTTTLSDIQQRLLEMLTPTTILVGHSLNADLNALKLTHPFIVDTGILFPHIKGPPFKQSLRWLAQKYLHRQIQNGSAGHDSIEDADTCLQLVKQKCEKGPGWGLNDTNSETIFKRLERTTRSKSNSEHRVGAVIDWGDPSRGHGAHAAVCIGCESDEDVVQGIGKAIQGLAADKRGNAQKVDFVWARLRELELVRGWWDDAKTSNDVEAIRQAALKRLGFPLGTKPDGGPLTGAALGGEVSRTVEHIVQIWESLAPRTAFIVYSGSGDPREVRRLLKAQQERRRDHASQARNEDQALSNAVWRARDGVGFIKVK